MKLFKIARRGQTAVILQEEAPVPTPGPGEVRIRVGAASLNHRDLLMLERAMDGSLDDRIPLSDGAGWVEGVGDGVTGFKDGDMVAAAFFPDWAAGPFRRQYLQRSLGGLGADGMLAEYVVMPAHAVVHTPPALTVEEAATLPCAAVTAWHGLVARGGMTKDSTVLVQGTGGVALFGLQFADAMGARSIVISSSEKKLKLAAGHGAAVLINYRDQPDWDAEVLSRTGGHGVSHVLELGGAGTIERSSRALAGEGHIVQIGGLDGFDLQPNLDALKQVSATVSYINVGSAAHFRDMNAFVSLHGIRPVVDCVFAFAEAPDAYAHLRGKGHFGKVVIRVG